MIGETRKSFMVFMILALIMAGIIVIIAAGLMESAMFGGMA